MTTDEEVINNLNEEMIELGIEDAPLQEESSKESTETDESEKPDETEKEDAKIKSKIDPPKPKAEEDKTEHTREDAFKQRQSKRREEVDGLKSEISELKDLVKQVLLAKSPDAKAEAKSELETTLEELGVDPTDERFVKLQESIRKDEQSKLPKVQQQQETAAVDPEVKKAQQAQLAQQEAAHFTEEWEEVVDDYIANDFPKANAVQLKQAKEALKQIAYTEKFHKTPLKYVYLEHKSKFSDILFQPKGRSSESGNSGPDAATEFDFDSEVESSEDAIKMEAELRKRISQDTPSEIRGGR